MPVLVEISGENEELSLAEAVALCHPDVPRVENLSGRIFHLSRGNALKIQKKGAMVHWAGEVIGTADCVENLSGIELGGATFRVNIKGECTNRHELIEQVVKKVRNGKVRLAKSESRLVLHVGKQVILCKIDRGEKEDFNARNPQHRPFFSPISMLPRQARVLLNLARIPEGGTVLDPLCGTGGLCLEAAVLGYKVMMSDIDPAMVKGAIQNLAHFGFKPKMSAACPVNDSPNIFPKVDCILTDPPYGRSSGTGGKGVELVVKEMFVAASKSLKKGGRLAVAKEETVCGVNVSVEI